ncbi:MAG: HAMP domain-containing sensor histidine kinase [Patescibacteria group bacterium]
MKISEFKECRELNLKFFECPSSLFLLNGIITVILIISTFIITRKFYSEEIAFLCIVFITVVMMVISYFVHAGTSKVATSKKRLQESNGQLRDTLLKLKEAEKRQQEFTHMMVHDLRSPLNGIRMVSEMVISDLKKKGLADLSEPLSLINQNAVSMLTDVNDILDVAKIEAGMFKLDKKKGDLIKLTQNIIQYFMPMAEGKNLILELKGADALPALKFDKGAIRQVFENLISNSLKFTPAGGRITVQLLKHQKNTDINEEAKKQGISWHLKGGDIKLNSQPDSVVVSVTDNGEGISLPNLSRLFNKFESMKMSSKTGEKGTGLGLVIVKGMIEAHGGVVGVAAKEGVGTTFYFNIPV